MDSAEASGFPGWPGSVCSRSSGRYLSGLGASAVGLCAAGWLVLTPYAFGYWDHAHHGPHDAALTDLATGGALAAVSLATMTCWAAAWRRRLRADGVLPATSRRQARRQARALRQHAHGAAAGGIPDPARVLADLRALLTALTADPVAEADGTSATAATARRRGGRRATGQAFQARGPRRSPGACPATASRCPPGRAAAKPVRKRPWPVRKLVPGRCGGGRGRARQASGARGPGVDAGRSRTAPGGLRRGGGSMVNRLALAGLVIIFATGSWLVAAPFAVRYQPAGAPWTGAARIDVAVGAILAAAGLGRLPGRAGRAGQGTVRRGGPAGGVRRVLTRPPG